MTIFNTNKVRPIGFLLFTVVAAVLLVKLGMWQISRGQEKEALLGLLAERQLQTLFTVNQLPDDAKGLGVSLLGSFDVSNSILLDNQVHQGQVGYRWMMPFIVDRPSINKPFPDAVFVGRPFIERTLIKRKRLLVEMGWIPAPPRRDVLPTLPIVEGKYQLNGVLDAPSKRILLAEDLFDISWPLRVQSIDLPKISEATGNDFLPWIVRLKTLTDQTDQLIDLNTTSVWTPVVMKPEKHYAYAVQWFGLVLVLIIGYGVWWKQREC